MSKHWAVDLVLAGLLNFRFFRAEVKGSLNGFLYECYVGSNTAGFLGYRRNYYIGHTGQMYLVFPLGVKELRVSTLRL